MKGSGESISWWDSQSFKVFFALHFLVRFWVSQLDGESKVKEEKGRLQFLSETLQQMFAFGLDTIHVGHRITIHVGHRITMHTEGPLFVNLMYFCLSKVVIRIENRVG